MLLLTTTSDLIQIITGAAVSTDIVTSYVDITTTGVTPGSFQVNVATATTTTIIASPAASTQRQVKMISVRNNSTTTAQTVTIQKSSTTAYNITGAITLNAGETLYYQDMYGFSVRDINGQIKQTINTTSASLTSTYVGYGNSSGVLTGSSGLTYSSTGNLVVGAPTSGVGLTVNTLSTSSVGLTVAATSGNITSLSIAANGTTAGTSSLDLVQDNLSNGYVYNRSNGALTFGTNNIQRMSISAAGDVSISAPTSGTALTVGGVYSTSTLSVASANGATGAVGDLNVIRAGSTANTIATGPNLALYDSTNLTETLLQQSGGQTELWQYNGGWNQILKVATTRGVTINAPASGTTLSVNGGSYGWGTSSVAIDIGNAGSVWSYTPALGDIRMDGNCYFNGSNFVYKGTGQAAEFEISTGSFSWTTAPSGNAGTTATMTVRMFLSNTGALTVNGVAVSSDINLKENFSPIPNPLGFITSLTGKRFDWIETKEHSVGLIAQEVEILMPELIQPGLNGTKCVNYNGIVACLVEAVKEQQKQIEAQQAQIEELKALVAALMTK